MRRRKRLKKSRTKTRRWPRLRINFSVNLIVQGMVQGNSDQLRVILNLDDAASGKRLWSQEFAGVPGDVLTLEDQIYGNVSRP